MRLEQAELAGGILLVKLKGALDIAGTGEIEAALMGIAEKYAKVIVNFTEVTFLASIGIRLLVKAARAVAKKDGRLVVFNPSEDARKVLRSTGIDSIIAVVADEKAAVAESGK
jgi:anti-anti-sigma factor